jgi:hypothetical protein
VYLISLYFIFGDGERVSLCALGRAGYGGSNGAWGVQSVSVDHMVGLVRFALASARQGMHNSIAHGSGGCQAFGASLGLF